LKDFGVKLDGGRTLGRQSIILQWILRKGDEMALNELSWLRIRTRGSPLNTALKLQVY
jgi:hypothetical protein